MNSVAHFPIIRVFKMIPLLEGLDKIPFFVSMCKNDVALAYKISLNRFESLILIMVSIE